MKSIEKARIKNRILDIDWMLNNNRVTVDDEWIEFCQQITKEKLELQKQIQQETA